MDYKLFFLLIAFTIFFGCYGQMRNLCDGPGTTPSDPPPIFVNDPAHCSRYLYCKRNGGVLVSVHQLDCRVNSGFPYFRVNPAGEGECVDSNDHCSSSCPNEEFAGVFVAVHDDPTCTQYFPCDFPPLLMTCATGLVFNRATGQCVLPAIAPCSNENIDTPECPRGPKGELNVSGFFPGSFCHSFILCINSEMQPGEFHCAKGQRFVPNPNPSESGQCQLDDTCDHSTNPTVPQSSHLHIQYAPTRNITNTKSYV